MNVVLLCNGRSTIGVSSSKGYGVIGIIIKLNDGILRVVEGSIMEGYSIGFELPIPSNGSVQGSII